MVRRALLGFSFALLFAGCDGRTSDGDDGGVATAPEPPGPPPASGRSMSCPDFGPMAEIAYPLKVKLIHGEVELAFVSFTERGEEIEAITKSKYALDEVRRMLRDIESSYRIDPAPPELRDQIPTCSGKVSRGDPRYLPFALGVLSEDGFVQEGEPEPGEVLVFRKPQPVYISPAPKEGIEAAKRNEPCELDTTLPERELPYTLQLTMGTEPIGSVTVQADGTARFDAESGVDPLYTKSAQTIIAGSGETGVYLQFQQTKAKGLVKCYRKYERGEDGYPAALAVILERTFG